MRGRDTTARGQRGLVLAILAWAAACARTPDPPPPVALPEPPHPSAPRLEEPAPRLPAPLPLAPRIRWSPIAPPEGTFATIIVEPEPRGLPPVELAARAGDRVVPLARLAGGAFLGLVPAPLGSEKVRIELTALLSDGSRVSRQLELQVRSREFPTTNLRVDRRFTAPDPETLERIRRERTLVRAALSVVGERPLWDGPFVLPLEGPTTSPYGQRRLFNRELRSQHTGLDIDGDTGDPVVAANSGRVVLSGDLFFNGNAVFIDHGLGLYTGYFHLSERTAREGEWVEKGQLIGRVGATGRVTGPHLHWGLYLLGSPLDPLALFDSPFTRISQRLPPTRPRSLP